MYDESQCVVVREKMILDHIFCFLHPLFVYQETKHEKRKFEIERLKCVMSE